MNVEHWVELLVALVALFVMALAALAQSLIGMTGQRQLEALAGREESSQRTLRSLLNPRRALSVSMLVIQVLSAVVATAMLTFVLGKASGRNVTWAAISIVGLVYLVLGQALPRALAESGAERFLHGVLQVARAAMILVWPLTWLVERIAAVFARLIPGEPTPVEFDGFEEELHRRFRYGDDTFGPEEREMIEGVLHLEKLTVRDVMVPRLDIIAVDRAVPPRELLDLIVKAGHSRIPVYQGSIDRVLGVLYAKDLLRFVIGSTNRIPLLDLIRPAVVVPESKRLSDMFTELKRQRIHIAIVADEYGGTAGIVTIEDILEEIVGEIQDEYDTESPLFELVEPDILLADGRLPIEDVEDALKLRFEEDDDFGTLGGFVHKHLQRLPMKGDVFTAEGVRVEILAVERHRVRRLRLTKLSPSRPGEENGTEAARDHDEAPADTVRGEDRVERSAVSRDGD